MAKLKVYASEDDVPEELAEFYSEVNGKWVPSVEGWSPADKVRMEDALEKERTFRKEAEGKLKAFEGVDAEGLADKLDRLEALEAAEGDVDAKIQDALQKQRDRLEEKARKEVAAVKEKAESLGGRVRKLAIQRDVDSKLVDLGVPRETVPVLRTYMESEHAIDVTQTEDGREVVVFKDENDVPIPADEWLASWAETPAANQFIHETTGSGSGSRGDVGKGGGRKGSMSRNDPSTWRDPETVEAIAKGEVKLRD